MMKRLGILLLALLPMMMSAKPHRQTVVLQCDLIDSEECNMLEKKMAHEQGVKEIECNLPAKTVTVTFDINKTDLHTLLTAFQKMGKTAIVLHSDSIPGQQNANQQNMDAYSGASYIE